MTATLPKQYRDLALDSSNEMMEYDSRWVLGRYPQAAWHIFQAGEGRRRMGILMRDAGNFAQAAADWLSASACFVLATQPHLVWAGLEKVRELADAGRIPPERRDVYAAIQERKQELAALESRLTAFHEEYRRLFGSEQKASPERLDYLRKRVREFPGYAKLHFAIYRQATELGQDALAAEHLRWAADFGADQAEYVGLYGYHLITSGQPDRAAEVARWFLTKHPGEPSIRVLLAQALVWAGTGCDAGRDAALEVLDQVYHDPKAPLRARLAAAALSGAIWRDQGNETEGLRFLELFNQLASSGTPGAETDLVVALRNVLTAPIADNNERRTSFRERFLAEPIRAELFSPTEGLDLSRVSVGA